MTDTLPPTDLALKRPAEVTARPRARPPVQLAPGRHVETLIGTRAGIVRELSRLSKSGELVDAGVMHVVPSGVHAGKLELRVICKDKRVVPTYAKVCIGLGSALGAGSAVFLVVAWFLASLSAASVAAICGAVLLGLAALLNRGRQARTPGVSVTVTTTVSVR